MSKRNSVSSNTTVYIEIEDMLKAKDTNTPEMSTGCNAIASIDSLLAKGCKVVIGSRNEILQMLNLAHPYFDAVSSGKPIEQQPDNISPSKPIAVGRNTEYQNKRRIEKGIKK